MSAGRGGPEGPPFPDMASTTWTRLRRAVAARGFTPASWIPAASEGRAEEATIRPARLVEQGEVGGIAV